jgi:hypothetical protein
MNNDNNSITGGSIIKGGSLNIYNKNITEYLCQADTKS